VIAVPEELLAVLTKHGVRFVVVGGYAAVLHGSPFLTEDLDITPSMSAENLERLSTALDELHARIRTEAVPDGVPFAHDAASLARADVWNLVTDHGDLDLTINPAGTGGYDDLARDAIDRTFLGLTVSIASLADIIRSKQAADRPKDHRTLPTLRRLLEEQQRRDRDA
jgi:hypothetical protein